MVIYKIDEDKKLVIEDVALKKLFKYCQRPGKNESGGILLGKIRDDYSEFIVVDISEPCNRDKSGRYFFVRDKKYAQEVVDKAWRLSDGEINYIGEWHTHPEINPMPSYVDKRLIDESLKTILNSPDTIFLLIVGMDSSLFVGCKSRHSAQLLKLNID